MNADHAKLIAEAVAEQPGTKPLRCREASMHSRETYIPCNEPATSFILSEHGSRVYPMCHGCADHNVRHRGAENLGEARR